MAIGAEATVMLYTKFWHAETVISSHLSSSTAQTAPIASTVSVNPSKLRHLVGGAMVDFC